MSRILAPLVLILVLMVGVVIGRRTAQQSYAGIDESVVEKLAAEHGRSATAPVINTDQGDLLLFVFLVAGVAAGFVGGVYFQRLFGHGEKGQSYSA